MKRALFFTALLLLSGQLLFAQKRMNSPRSFNVFSEYYFNTDSSCLYIAYRVQNRALIFSKENEHYSARFSVSVEASDSLSALYFRQIIEDTIDCTSLDETKSDKSKQGIISLPIRGKVSSLQVSFIDLQSDREIRRQQFGLNKSLGTTAPIRIIAVIPFTKYLSENSEITLSNADGAVPFSSKVSGIAILHEKIPDTLKICLTSSDTSIYQSASMTVSPNVQFRAGNNTFQLSAGKSDTSFTFSLFSNISEVLLPGVYSLSLQSGTDTVTTNGRQVRVFWFDSPVALRSQESAIKLLDLINVDSDSLMDLKRDRESVWSLVFKFWKKFDPNPTNAYNEVLEEFYRRVDYVIENFSTLKGNDGETTGRGKVYIKFGKPLRIESSPNANGKIIEHWKYSDGKSFYFFDATGSGNYELIKEQ